MNTRLLKKTRARLNEKTRGEFLFFLRRVVGSVSPGVEYSQGWHMEAIAEYLSACERGQVRRLIINLPPRMLKSTIISVAWPAWLLGHKPTQRLMVASYAQGLSLKHSTDCRVVVASDWYQRLFPATRLASLTTSWQRRPERMQAR